MQVEAFSTNPLSPSQSVRDWQAAVYRLNAHDFVTKPRGLEPFHGSLRSFTSRRHRFGEVAVSSHIVTSRPITSKPYMLVLLNDGTAHVLQDGRETMLSPGEAVLVDISRPLRIEAGPLRASVIDISPSRIREILPQVDGLTAIGISGQAAGGAILRTTMLQLFALPTETDDEVVDHVADAILHLVAAALTESPAAKNAVPRRSEAYHRQRVLEFVRSRLEDKGLNPHMIAQALGLSPRYIHRLFEGKSVTLMQRVWNQRLERCRDELALPSLAHRSISEIAYGWGFSTPAHFSRAFTARFGECPREFRRSARNPPSRIHGKA